MIKRKKNKTFIFLLCLFFLSLFNKSTLAKPNHAKNIGSKNSSTISQKIENLKDCTVSIVVGDEIIIQRKIDIKSVFISALNNEKRDDGVVSHGSGISLNSLKLFLPDQDSHYFLTNSHVVDAKTSTNQKIFICTEKTPTPFCNKSEVIFSDKDFDLAILKADIPSCDAHIKIEDNPKVGAKIFAIGNKMGLGLSLNFGNLSSKNKVFLSGNEKRLFHFLDIGAGYGNSGGPAFLENGNLIAILKGSYSSSSENTSIILGITGEEIKKSLERMEEMFELEKNLGLELEENSQDIIIKHVTKSDIFEYKDLEGASTIQSFNGKYLSSKAELIFEIYKFLKEEKSHSTNFTITTQNGKLKKSYIVKKPA